MRLQHKSRRPITLDVHPLEDRTNPAPPGSGWQMLWEDDFLGSSVNTSTWAVATGPRRDAVNTAAALSVSGGNLTITTHTSGGTHYTGFLGTYNSMVSTYGYWEARVNFASSPGMWSAFWLQSPTMGNPLGNPAAAGTEIDIVEHRKVDSGGADISNKAQINIHWDGYGASHQSVGSGNVNNPGTPSLQGNFHLYAMQWNPSGYQFYIDGTQVWSTTTAVSKRSEFIYLSSEVEDDIWAGSIPTGGYGSLAASTTKMIVDYVRVWQKPISATADQTTREDTAIAALPVTITQKDGLSNTLTAASSNTNLLPVANVSFGGSGANRTTTLTPAADRTGVSTVTLTAGNAVVSGNDAFTFTVNAGSAANLGFESDLTGWNTYGNVTAANYNQHSGSRALRIVNAGGAEQVITGLSPNTTYTLGGWGRNTTGTAGNEGYLGVKNYGGSQLLTSFTTTSHALKTLTFTTGAANTTTTIFAYRSSAANESFFDDFYLFRTPTLTTIASQSIFRNYSTAPLAVTVGHVSSNTASWSLAASSSNTTLVPNANIVLGGSGVNRTVTVTPAANQTGTATITLTVNDGLGGVAVRSFTVIVLTPPTVTGSVVNGGAAQRSRITSIGLTFASGVPVSALDDPGVITLTRGGGITVATGATGANGRVNVSPTAGTVTTATLIFDNANNAAITAGVEHNSLSDGVWTLRVAGVTIATFKRLFGDVTADGTVDGSDLTAFGNAFNTTNIAFDFDNDNVIDGGDLTAFGNHFGMTI